MHTCLQGRYGNSTGALVALGIPLVAMFFCGASSVTSNSRCLLCIRLEAGGNVDRKAEKVAQACCSEACALSINAEPT